MTEKTYNGWTNYETWNAALWLDQERVLSKSAHKKFKDPLTRNCIEAWLDEIASEAASWPRGILRDLCLDALERVDLNEIIATKGIDQ